GPPNGGPTSKTVYDNGKMIDDYIFHDNRAYFTTNANSPFGWSLFEYDPESGETQEVDENVSYGDFMKTFGGKLLYYKVSGEHADVYTYSNSAGSKRLSAVSPSSVTSALTRKEITAGERNAVLVESKEDAGGEKPLVIWLHGGPNRQTSIGYHPYLSYAVYDELLERLAEAGARVVKLDYMGSTGYGKKFENGLTKKMGKADVADVERAIDDLKDSYKTSGVYLIGNSYGGYLSLKTLIENPRDIAGVASIAGVVDWKKLVNDIPTTIFAKSFGGVPGAKTNKYYKTANILSGVDDIDDDTPIVVAYGTADATIPPNQSKLFIEKAKDEDKNVKEVVFEGEDHILRKRSTLNRLCEEVTKAFDLSDSVCR
ncbi:MAG: alpha/beta fold hydrolase, partial [Patescibacteria group bacterium]